MHKFLGLPSSSKKHLRREWNRKRKLIRAGQAFTFIEENAVPTPGATWMPMVGLCRVIESFDYAPKLLQSANMNSFILSRLYLEDQGT